VRGHQPDYGHVQVTAKVKARTNLFQRPALAYLGFELCAHGRADPHRRSHRRQAPRWALPSRSTV